MSEITILTDELRAQLAPEFKALEDAAMTKGKSDGAAAERERIKAVEAQGENLPGHDALIQEMKFDGKTTGPEAAVRLLAAEKTKKANRAADIRADAPQAVPQVPINDPAKPETAKNGNKPTHDPSQANALAKEAEVYQRQQAKEGNDVALVDAIKFVYQRAGVPLR
jgi:hypothetical protein